MRAGVAILAVSGALALPLVAILVASVTLPREGGVAPVASAAAVDSGSASSPAPTPGPERRAGDASPVDAKLVAAGEAARERPGEAKLLAAHAALLAQKGREVSNAAYHQMAEREARRALAIDATHDGARSALAIALAGQHRFDEALTYLRSVPGKTVWRFACEIDCLYELGRYPEAVAAAQAFADWKPGPESYPRAAQLRELHGDAEGALEIWREALQASVGFDLAWALAQTGDCQLRRGDRPRAREAYEESLKVLPGYHLPRIGLARLAAAAGHFQDALDGVKPLLERHGDLPTAGFAGDLAALLGRKDEAEAIWSRALAAEELSARAGVPDRRGLALFLADHDREPERAVALARAAVEAAPTIAATDALAWALLKAGKNDEAREASQRARRLGTRTASLLWHAAAIERALGHADEARRLTDEAFALGLEADPLQARRARP